MVLVHKTMTTQILSAVLVFAPLVSARAAESPVHNYASGCSSPAAYPTSPNPSTALPRNAVIADFDGARGPDIAILNITETTLALLLNNGDGTFQPAITYPTPLLDVGVPAGLAAADLDGVNGPDVAYTGERSTQLSVRYNLGGGVLGPEVALPLGFTAGGKWVEAVDLDGGTGVDLVMGSDSWVAVYRNDGSGGFTGPVYYSSAGYVLVGHALADLDADGDIDVLASGPVDQEALVRILNDGTGAFSAPLRVAGISASCRALAVADLDSLNGLDILCNDVWALGTTVFLADGFGGFLTPRAYGSGDGETIDIVDMDCGNGPDIVTSRFAGTVSILLNRGDGSFLPEQIFPAGSFSSQAVVADFNQANGLDWAALNGGDGTVTVALDCVAGPCLTNNWLLRNDDIGDVAPLDILLADVFRAAGGTLIEDGHVEGFLSGDLDPDPVVLRDATRPLVFYQVTDRGASLKLSRAGDRVKVDF